MRQPHSHFKQSYPLSINYILSPTFAHIFGHLLLRNAQTRPFWPQWQQIKKDRSLLLGLLVDFHAQILLAVPAVPLVGQLTLVDTVDVKPLQFAEGVVAHDHGPEGGPPAVAVLRFVGVVLPLAPLGALFDHALLATLAPQLLLGLVDPACLQLLLQFLSGFMDEIIETLGDGNFFPGLSLDIQLNSGDALIIEFNLLAHLGGLSIGLVLQLFEKVVLHRLQLQLELLDLLVKVPDLSEQFVGLWWDEVEPVQQLFVGVHKPIDYRYKGRLILVQKQIKFITSTTHSLLYLNQTDMKKPSQDLPLLVELQADQMDIHKIRQQQILVNKIQNTLAKKDHEIQSLKALLHKYQHYQQKYQSLKVQLQEKTLTSTKKDAQIKLLRKNLEEMIREAQEANRRTKRWEEQKQQLIRQRHSFERSNKQSERTFKQYQQECKRREQQLLQDLEQAYQSHREQTTKIDELELQVQDSKALKAKIKQLEKQLEQQQFRTNHSQQTPAHRPNFTQNDDLSNQLLKLKQELLRKEEELSKQQVLNYQLTMEYDQTVSSLCQLESEVSRYRRENIQLKKKVSLMKEQSHSQKIEIKYLGKNRKEQGKSKEVSSMDFQEQSMQECSLNRSTHHQISATS